MDAAYIHELQAMGHGEASAEEIIGMKSGAGHAPYVIETHALHRGHEGEA